MADRAMPLMEEVAAPIPGTVASDLSAMQFRTLLRKNVLLYRRQTKLVTNEVFNLVLYYVILIGLSFVAKPAHYDAVPATQFASLLNATSLADSLCPQWSTHCTLGFIDDDRSTCRANVQQYKDKLAFCALPVNGVVDTDVRCPCVPHTRVANSTTFDGLGAAVQMHDLSGNMTLHVPHIDSRVFDMQFTDPRWGSPTMRWQGGAAFPPSVLLLMAQLLDQLVDAVHPNATSSAVLTIDGGIMGVAAYNNWAAGRLGNVPFYLTVLFLYGIVTVTVAIADERDKKLVSGMLMCGLKLTAYWKSWAVILCARQLLTVTLGMVILRALPGVNLLQFCDPTVLLVLLLLFAVYTIVVGLTMASFLTKAKSVQMWILLGGMLMSAPVYIYSALFNVGPNAASPAPSWVIVTLSVLFGPFAFSQCLATLSLLDNAVDGGVKWASFFARNRTGVSFGTSFFCLLAATLLAFLCMRWALFRNEPRSARGRAGVAAHCDYHPAHADTGEGDNKVAVAIRDLSKHFGSNHAVNGLTVDFFQNQITSFLGHNGAGKSTTIQVLTGLHPPTGGDAFVFGRSIAYNMQGVRAMLGVCPQENVMWDQFSAAEHVLLFAGLRGVHPASVDVLGLLREVGLESKADTHAKLLSGGQKRKLQLAIALAGDPKVIFLDEPTAGMDIQARRDVWTLLAQKKQGRAIVLTTHHMDEADILGDRIAVIDAGQLQVVGTSAMLKTQFATGHHLDVSLGDDCTSRDSVLQLIRGVGGPAAKADVDLADIIADDASSMQRDRARRAALAASGSGDLQLILPTDAAPQLPDIFELLERSKASGKHGIRGFGVVSTTLEDVFCELADQGDFARRAKQAAAEQLSNGAISGTSVNDLEASANKVYNRPGFWRKMKMLLVRKLHSAYKMKVDELQSAALPLLMAAMCVGLLRINFFPPPGPSPTIDLSAASSLAPPSAQDERFVLAVEGNGHVKSSLEPTLKQWQQTSVSLPEVWQAGHSGGAQCSLASFGDSFVHWLLSASPVCSSGKARLGGYEFKGTQVTLLANESDTLSAPGLITLFYDTLVANATKDYTTPLRPKLAAVPAPPKSSEDKALEDVTRALITASIGPMLLTLGLLPMVGKSTFDVVDARATGIKHLQVLMGVRGNEYWLSQLIWDAGSKAITVCATTMILFGATGSSLGEPAVFLLLVAFLFSLYSCGYVISFAFDNPQVASGAAISANMVTFMVSFIGYLVTSVPTLKLNPAIADSLRYVGMVISPGAALNIGLQGIVMAKAYNKPMLGWGDEVENVKVGAGEPLFFLVIQAIMFFSITMFIEAVRTTKVVRGAAQGCVFCFDSMRALARRLCPCMYRASTGVVSMAASADIEDDDVVEERRRVDVADANGGDAEYAVRLSHLRKQYSRRGMEAKGTLAVADLCLRMKRGECFALLGTNGAGKSTTFDMLLRKQLATRGNAFVNEVDTASVGSADSVFLELGYCPQHNALYSEMTGREVMDFYCAIRGVPDSVRAAVVTSRLADADLTEHADRPCGRYSGGNKRKLMLAVALCGDPTLAVLDEPSAGIDPAARRRLWRVVNASLARGCTVALTTHHMAEAAHLGRRIGIMVRGRMACIGSPQHLKLKYGQGYEVSVTLKSDAPHSVQASVVPLLNRLSPAAEVVDNPSDKFVRVSLGKAGSDFSLATLYRELEASRDKLGIEFFTASQANMESVFARFAKQAQGNDTSTGEIYSMKAQLEDMEKWPSNVPPSLEARGVGPAEWEAVLEHTQGAMRRGHPFGSRPGLEACYFCFPLLCAQWLLCMLNPCTYRLYRNLRPELVGAANAVSQLLESKCIRLVVKGSILGMKLVFEGTGGSGIDADMAQNDSVPQAYEIHRNRLNV